MKQRCSKVFTATTGLPRVALERDEKCPWASLASLAARGETPAAFDERCILARLGAIPEFDNGLPIKAHRRRPVVAHERRTYS